MPTWRSPAGNRAPSPGTRSRPELSRSRCDLSPRVGDGATRPTPRPRREREHGEPEGDVEEHERVLEGAQVVDGDADVVADADEATHRIDRQISRRLRQTTLPKTAVPEQADGGEQDPGH